MDTRPIGIFDSGVGGITVFSELVKALPNESMIYLGDTKQFPYGNKSKETIIELAKKNIEFLIEKDVKAIVIACGTATSQALDTVKKIYNIPIIGIIEPTVLSIKDEKINKIGVMGTTGTIHSGSWETAIKKYMPSVDVINKACPILAQIAEEGWTDNEIAKLTIEEYLEVFKKTRVDKLILGCTHYPMFMSLIKQELGNATEIIDTGKKVGSYLKKQLEEKNILNDTDNPRYRFYLTDMESSFLKVASKLLKKDIQIEKANI